jgi:hypothetical protein
MSYRFWISPMNVAQFLTFDCRLRNTFFARSIPNTVRYSNEDRSTIFLCGGEFWLMGSCWRM